MNAEQEIVKPYLDKLKENISFLDTYDDIEVEDEFGNTNRTKYVDFYEVMETIDDLLSGEEECIPKMKEALEMAIQALEQEPCEDAISRQAAIDACLSGWNKDYKEIVEEIRTLPPVTPKPKMGRWINIEDRTDWYDTSYKCSCCGREIITPYDFKNNLYSDYPYCHCGARMVKPQESEE